MVLEKIRQVYPQLTKSQKRLADFIANSYREAAFMTASRLARRLDINEATVIRFAQRLGYAGYPEMIRDVQAVVQEELKTRAEPEAEAAMVEPFVASLGLEMESIDRAVSHVSPELAHRLVGLLRGTRRIYVAGQGVSHYLGGILAVGLAGLGLDARLASGEPQGLALALADLENTDALVGISATQESQEVARALAAARERGARTVAVTWSPISQTAQAADLALICPTDELFTTHSVGATAVFMDALVQSLAGIDPVGTRQFRQMIDKALQALRGA